MSRRTQYRSEQSDMTSCCTSTCWGQRSSRQKERYARTGFPFAEDKVEHKDKADSKETSVTDPDQNRTGAKVYASHTTQETELAHLTTTVGSSMCVPAAEDSISSLTADQTSNQPYLVANLGMPEQEEDSQRQEVRNKAPNQGQEEVRPKLNKNVLCDLISETIQLETVHL